MKLCVAEMSSPPQACITMEDIPLNTTPGSGGSEDEVMSSKMGKRGAASFFTDQHYRRLAICSIICGCSCIGIKSLINSVKVIDFLSLALCSLFD